MARACMCFSDKQRAWLALGDPRLSGAVADGHPAPRMPPDAPSRSALKLAEAFDMFCPPKTSSAIARRPARWTWRRARRLTWQLLRRGLRVIAVDNGLLKGMVAEHPGDPSAHDGFASARIARWTGWCAMVEKPSRAATLMANWLIGDHARHAMFNLKLPMKNVRKRWKAR